MYRSAIALVIVLSMTCIVRGQSTERASLSPYLDQLAQSRSAVKTYTVRLTGTIVDRDVRSTMSDKTFHSAALFHVEMACDMQQDASLILVQPSAFLPGTVFYPPSPSAVSQVYLIKEKRASFLSPNGQFADLGDSQRVPIPDPLALGTGFCVESTRFFRARDSVAQLRSWEKGRMEVKHAGVLTTFHDAWQDIPKAYSTAITFDTSRGGMVREIVHAADPRKRDFIRGEVEPVKVGEHWLPRRVAYTCGNGQFFTWEMDWVSVNSPLPEDLFEPETLRVMLGVAK